MELEEINQADRKGRDAFVSLTGSPPRAASHFLCETENKKWCVLFLPAILHWICLVTFPFDNLSSGYIKFPWHLGWLAPLLLLFMLSVVAIPPSLFWRKLEKATELASAHQCNLEAQLEVERNQSKYEIVSICFALLMQVGYGLVTHNVINGVCYALKLSNDSPKAYALASSNEIPWKLPVSCLFLCLMLASQHLQFSNRDVSESQSYLKTVDVVVSFVRKICIAVGGCFCGFLFLLYIQPNCMAEITQINCENIKVDITISTMSRLVAQPNDLNFLNNAKFQFPTLQTGHKWATEYLGTNSKITFEAAQDNGTLESTKVSEDLGLITESQSLQFVENQFSLMISCRDISPFVTVNLGIHCFQRFNIRIYHTPALLVKFNTDYVISLNTSNLAEVLSPATIYSLESFPDIMGSNSPNFTNAAFSLSSVFPLLTFDLRKFSGCGKDCSFQFDDVFRGPNMIFCYRFCPSDTMSTRSTHQRTTHQRCQPTNPLADNQKQQVEFKDSLYPLIVLKVTFQRQKVTTIADYDSAILMSDECSSGKIISLKLSQYKYKFPYITSSVFLHKVARLTL